MRVLFVCLIFFSTDKAFTTSKMRHAQCDTPNDHNYRVPLTTSPLSFFVCSPRAVASMCPSPPSSMAAAVGTLPAGRELMPWSSSCSASLTELAPVSMEPEWLLELLAPPSNHVGDPPEELNAPRKDSGVVRPELLAVLNALSTA